MTRLRARAFIVLLLSVSPLLAQNVTVGRLSGGIYGFIPAGNVTLVDFAHPALKEGNVTTATVRWLGVPAGGCTATLKVKIVRPAALGAAPRWPAFTVVAERGPFDVAANGYVTVPLSPAIAVQPGDMLAIVQVKPSCGGAATAKAEPASIVLESTGDLVAGTFSGNFRYGFALSARAADDANVLDGVIAAGGAVAGSNGSFFRTAIQLTNPDVFAPVSGKVVFHQAGRSPLPSDPSTGYTLAAGATVSYPDIVATMGAAGLGSIDIVTTNSPSPVAAVRVFDDAGAAGTKGFTEDVIVPEHAMREGDQGMIPLPADMVNFRANVGVRALDGNPQIRVTQYGNNGTTAGFAVKDYANGFFEQVPLGTFLGGTIQPTTTSMRIDVLRGAVVLYMSTTDNRTNDSSIKFLARQ